MKFASNGALTIGTLDGANIEIKDKVGDENIVIFGLTADEVAERRAQRLQSPARSSRLRANCTRLWRPSPRAYSRLTTPNAYTGLMGGLYDSDWFMVAADFEGYTAAQRDVDRRWEDQKGWREAAIRNIANVAGFRPTAPIGEYARDIWGVL